MLCDDPGTGSQIYLAAGKTYMRKGIPGLSALVQVGLNKEPLSGDVFVFRGRRGDQIKVLWFSGDGHRVTGAEQYATNTECLI